MNAGKTVRGADRSAGVSSHGGPVLEVRDLRTHYFKAEGVVKAVDGVSFDIGEGEMVAIVGESGCGKTATALSLVDLVPNPPGKVVGGEVRYRSRDLRTLSDEQLRRVRGKEIGMVFQEPMVALNPVLTVGCQLTEPMFEHLGLSRAEAKARACELLSKVGIPDPEGQLSQYPFQLSGGMRQRLMIAIALSCEPHLIIADEPTTALDVTVQAQILELMKRLSVDLQVSFLVITHNLGIVARYADRVNVMYAGRIVEKGSTFDVFSSPRHPYTRGLVASIPRLDKPAKARLDAIEGQPPDLSEPIQGCAFAPRCRFAETRCRETYPKEISVDGGHTVCCWYAG